MYETIRPCAISRMVAVCASGRRATQPRHKACPQSPRHGSTKRSKQTPHVSVARSTILFAVSHGWATCWENVSNGTAVLRYPGTIVLPYAVRLQLYNAAPGNVLGAAVRRSLWALRYLCFTSPLPYDIKTAGEHMVSKPHETEQDAPMKCRKCSRKCLTTVARHA